MELECFEPTEQNEAADAATNELMAEPVAEVIANPDAPTNQTNQADPADDKVSLPRGKQRRISLALQGGGAWGAFTCGALDQILSRRDIGIDSISGTSAGAMNGAIVCSELARGSARSAREALESFWHDIAEHPSLALFRTLAGPVGEMVSRRVGDWFAADGMTPYKVDPLDLNPLRTAIENHVDIAALRSGKGPELFVTATNVRTGLPRVFASSDITIEALMASACLPQLFRPVEIDGEFYWDGGYAGNPTLWPLVRYGQARDLILIQLTPGQHQSIPRDAKAIRERVVDLVFNASLVAEMQAIHSMQEQARRDGSDSAITEIRLHRIGPPSPELLANARGALDRSWSSLTTMRDEGRNTAQRFFRKSGAAIGVESTLDIARHYLDPRKPRVRMPARESG